MSEASFQNGDRTPNGLLGGLSKGACHVYYAFPEGATDRAAEHMRLLSASERARHGRYRFERDRQLYLVAHALTRTVLSYYRPVEAQDWRFEPGRHGKPEIVSPSLGPRLRVNLSHTGGLVACAVALDDDVGVDVEDSDRETSILSVAERVFSDTELRDLHAQTGDGQRHRFFEYWTLKEAYIKADGRGITLPLRAITFTLREGLPIQVRFGAGIEDDPTDWRFAQLRPTERHHLALALRCGTDLSVRSARITP
ncbi:4'-phosphopantetheinyl transferase family protein [Planctomycetota bacterium]